MKRLLDVVGGAICAGFLYAWYKGEWTDLWPRILFFTIGGLVYSLGIGALRGWMAKQDNSRRSQ